MDVTADSVKEAYPDVHKAISDMAFQAGLDEGQRVGIETGIAQGKAEGAKIERERIAGIKAKAGKSLASPVIAALVDTLIADGQTTPDQAASAILGAINADLEKRKVDFQTDSVGALGSGIAPNGSGVGSEFDFEALVTQYMEANKVSKGAAIKAVAKANPAAHDAWLGTLRRKEESNV